MIEEKEVSNRCYGTDKKMTIKGRRDLDLQ